MFPLRAVAGGVRQRPGHTEAAVELCRLAGCEPVGVIAEVVDDSGEMLRLERPAQVRRHPRAGARFHRRARGTRVAAEGEPAMSPARDPLASHGGPVVQLAHPLWHLRRHQAWIDTETGAEHLSLTAAGEAPDGGANTESAEAAVVPLVRLHSECLTGDVFGSFRWDCGEQLDYALEMIQRHGGTLLYLRGHEGRGIGLANKMRAYSLQEAGADTVEANEQLGLPVDSRDYTAAGGHPARPWAGPASGSLSNNPLKSADLSRHGIDVVDVVPEPERMPARSRENLRYLQTKRDRMHHALNLETPTRPPTSEGPSL